MAERLVVALVRGIHGLHGDVRIEVLTDHPERRFAAGSILYLEGDDSPLTIAAAAEIVDGPGWRVRFRERADRTAVESLRDQYLEADRAGDDGLESGSVYWHELVGVQVTGLDGTSLGTIADIYTVGETEAVVVRGGSVGEFDVPLLRVFVKEFDPRAGRFVVDAALLDLATSPRAAGDRPRAPRRRPCSRRGRGGGSDPGNAADGTAGRVEPAEPAEAVDGTAEPAQPGDGSAPQAELAE